MKYGTKWLSETAVTEMKMVGLIVLFHVLLKFSVHCRFIHHRLEPAGCKTNGWFKSGHGLSSLQALQWVVHSSCFRGCGVSIMLPTNVIVLDRSFALYIGLVVYFSNPVTGFFILFRGWAKFAWCPIGQTRCQFPSPFVNGNWIAVWVTIGE